MSAVFTIVLVAAVTPAVHDAEHAAGTAELEGAAARIHTAAEQLASRGQPPPAGVPGARRTFTLTLPDGGALAIENESRVLRAELDAGPVGTWAFPVPVLLSESSIRLRGRVHLTLSYRQRADGPVIVLTRGFIRESEAKKGYADPSRARRGLARPTHRFGRLSV